MNIRRYKAFTGTSERSARRRSRMQSGSRRVLKQCLGIIKEYEALDLWHQQFRENYTAGRISREAYIPAFEGIMAGFDELVHSYGRTIDHFFTMGRHRKQPPEQASGHYYETIIGGYQLLQKRYQALLRLYHLTPPVYGRQAVAKTAQRNPGKE